MRLLTTFAVILFFSSAAFSQIVKEHEYTSSANLVELAISGDKYYTLNWTASTCELYNLDHTLWKTINLAVPAGQYLYDVRHVSETLFNVDSKVELAYTYYAYDTTLFYYTYTTQIINEDGTVVLSLTGASYSEIHALADKSTKMLAWLYDYSVIPYTVRTVVLALPGTIFSDKQPGGTMTEQHSQAFPNPCSGSVTVPYVWPDHAMTGTLEVTDMSGRITHTYPVGKGFNDLVLNTEGWPKGAYHYRVVAGGSATKGGTFIVR